MSPIEASSAEFRAELADKAELINGLLKRVGRWYEPVEPGLGEAINYVLEGKGKRIRGSLVMWCCEAVCGQVREDAKWAAAAIEMVHAYSLVHDDLPAMDDDDFRRGRPSCHKAFGEAAAILAGDAVLTMAFELLCREIAEPDISVKMVQELASAAGPGGMIAGQAADLRAETEEANLELLEYIHANKTARMFRCAAAMGATAGGASQADYDRLSEYGMKIGLCFQISDDILDVQGSKEQLGKTAGKDARAGKLTYPSLVGLEKSVELEQKLTREAIETVEGFGGSGWILRSLAGALAGRKN